MAKRAKQAAAVAADPATDTLTAPQLSEVVPVRSPEVPQVGTEPSSTEQPTRKFMADPFPIKTVNLEGYKLQLQENRQSRTMQIKFGDGSLKDKPSDAIREFVKAPDGPEGIKFHWKDEDRAWGTRIDPEAPATSRQKAEQVFKEVVKRVAEEKGVVRQL
jgi:hypothetical protein